MREYFYFIVFLASIVFAMDVRAQLVWNVIHTDQIGTTQYTFYSIDCADNNCTAGLIIHEYNPYKWTPIFYQTTDGGETWFSQVPDVEFPGDFPNKGFFKIQRIDSLNIVAISEEFIIRTFDGGITWERQTCAAKYRFMDIHFSDPLTGVLVAAGISDNIFLTSDGGRHWIASSFNSYDFAQCHSYGNGKFRLVRYQTAEVFTTTDNFSTVDSTKSVVDTSLDKHWYGKILATCTFGNGDTILAYGNAAREGIEFDTLPGYSLVVRTTNGGKQWEKPHILFGGIYGRMHYTTPLDRDTVVAVGESFNRLFLSFDKGATWKIDTLLLLDTTYQAVHPQGLAMTGNGHLIGAFTSIPFSPGHAILTRGKWLQNNGIYELISYKTRVFPNPAATNLSIVSPLTSTAVYMYDIMGREVLRSMLSDKGELTIDIAHLPNGIYTLSLDYQGKRVLVDKVVVKK